MGAGFGEDLEGEQIAYLQDNAAKFDGLALACFPWPLLS